MDDIPFPLPSDIAKLSVDDVGAPAFGAPWHAQIFGLAMTLAQAGVFTWADWMATFSAEIRRHPQTSQETVEAAYYRQWSEALIALLGRTGHVNDEELAITAEDWRRSYLATEHGQPITFRRDLPPPGADHHHHHHHHQHDHDAEMTAPIAPVSIAYAIS